MSIPSEQQHSRALYTLNPTGRFSDRADDYRRFRPSYPAPAIDAILAGLGRPETLRAADIGAGTGISSRLLADRGVRVHAVEPNRAMREAADKHPRVTLVDGTAEETGLEPQAFDLVLAAQAFHWFRPEESLREFHRILRPNGRLAVMWNERDLTDPLTAVYSDIISRASNRAPEEKWHIRPEELYISQLFSTAWELTFVYEQSLNAEGLVGRAISASYVPNEGDARAAVERDLRAAHQRFAGPDGTVHLLYRTILYLSQPIHP
ncbi:MAG: class I SAM-dependent methyltransferase [Phycisphaeraceae bacterium]|nr:class I SAM-dependent methyltransferase [Phycisphaeraceae bacterium]MCW5768320.1 class I SAM-dependent methyltransferase [Phycisphaeraceae bacterium]